MAKLLIIKEKREKINDRERVVIKPKKYLLDELKKDFDTKYGVIKKEDLKKNGIVKTSLGKDVIICDVGFSDIFKRLKKLPQSIPLKDIGLIISETGINKDSLVVDAGTGSGHLACFLANICKHVYTYEIKEENIRISKENAERLELKNITFHEKSIYDGIEEKNVDIITLDLPDPKKALDNCVNALKVGGFIVVYSLCLGPLEDFLESVGKKEGLLYIKTVEVLERMWKIDGRITRPDNIEIGHSGFLSFVRKIL
jgi:tRNA (adenine57-N1/adenine58-N1)-methyltransferase catalytic subunit